MKISDIIKITLYALTGIQLLTACNSSDNNATVYIPNAGAIVKANFYISDEPDVRTFTIKITPESYPDLNPKGASSEALIFLKADPAMVTTYNELHNTDYLVLPEGCYTVTESVKIEAGKNESEAASITVRSKGFIKPFQEYLLPVSISGAEGIDCADCCQTIYYLYRGSIDASSMTLLDRSEWTVLAASSEEPREGDWGHSGLKEACIDDDLNTFWGTDWSTNHPQPPHWITIDLGKTTTIQGMAIQAREEGYDGAKEAYIEISDDGESWVKAGEFKDIPAKGQFRSLLPEAVEARYIKLTITAVNGGPHVTVSELHLL